MELKEFIKDTVTQIADAVTELNGGDSKYQLTVNPIGSLFDSNDSALRKSRQTCRITNIDFDLSLVVSENKGSGAKVGVFASIIGAGVSANENTQNEYVSKIKFSLPVSLPNKEVLESNSNE